MQVSIGSGTTARPGSARTAPSSPTSPSPFLTASLIFRTIAIGHGPFANMYEFSIAFAWGTLGDVPYFERRYHQRVLGLVALPIALRCSSTR